MRKMYIVVIAIGMLIQNVALADNFNYSSLNECQSAMDDYGQRADGLASSARDDWDKKKSFMHTARFFNAIYGDSSGGTKRCTDGTCTETFDASCRLLDESAGSAGWHVLWNKFIVPLLEKEVSDLQNEQADSNVPIPSSISCTYRQGSPIDWNNNCKLN